MKWFKAVTMGKPLVMGRKTFQSIGRALPGRDNIVITRDHQFSAEGAFITGSLNAAVELAKACAMAKDLEEICIIGGGEIYRQSLPYVDRIYLTRVDADVEGDAYFPALEMSRWNEKIESHCSKSEKNEFDCEFVILDRRLG